MTQRRYISCGEEFQRAVDEGAMNAIIAQCVQTPSMVGCTIQECLDCGISNPYAPEYSMIGEIDTGNAEMMSLDEVIEVEYVEWDANGSPVY